MEPSDASRLNSGLCGTQASATGCEPLASQARVSRWWDVLRSHSHENMESLWDTGRFRVKSHSCDRQVPLSCCFLSSGLLCNAFSLGLWHGIVITPSFSSRDYQHLSSLQGCAPSFGLTYEKRGALGFIRLDTAGRFYPSRTKNTHVQTFGRNGYTVVGLGRPPFDISNADGFSNINRKTGFLSAPGNIFLPTGQSDDEGKSIFMSCKTLDQCFVDDFYFNGRPVSRRVFTTDNRMRDWEPKEGERCGIFGIEESDELASRSCPGIDTLKQSCCSIDSAVAPLYHVLKRKAGILEELNAVCNEGLLFGKVQKSQAIFSMESVQKHLAEIPDFYMVPKNDKTARSVILDGIRDRLNSITDEFTPEFQIDTAFSYVQVMDCSEAVYETLQKHTTCSENEAKDSSAFCPEYAYPAANRSGLYYFLDFTMTEFPFAWWHKCMLLKSKTFSQEIGFLTMNMWASSSSSSDSAEGAGIIQCEEWNVNSIPASEMQLASASYVGGSAYKKLFSVEGGITSATVTEAVDEMKKRLLRAVNNFIDGGDPTFEESSSSSSSSMAHRGSPKTLNMKCYSMAKFPTNVSRFKSQTSPQQDCILDILSWMHNEDSNTERWLQRFSLSRYWTSMARSCLHLDKNDLVPYSSSSSLTEPFSIVDQFLTGGGNPAIFEDIQFNDFFQGAYNTLDGGLLLAEFVPSRPIEAEDVMTQDLLQIHGILDPDLDRKAFEDKFGGVNLDAYPCVTVEDIERRLPSCEPNSLEPVRLSKAICRSMVSEARLAIEEYALNIRKFPSTFPQKQVNFWRMFKEENDIFDLYRAYSKNDVCVWDCGNDFALNEKVHIGLDPDSKRVLLSMLSAKSNLCQQYAEAGGYVYLSPDFNQTIDDAASIAADNFKSKHGGVTMQEVCGHEYRLCKSGRDGSYWECFEDDGSLPKEVSDPKLVASNFERIFDAKDQYKRTHRYR